jgi:DNA polymerase III epsilon subunit-like protein
MTDQRNNPLRGRMLVVVDVEGNGQQPPEIIEIAALPIDDGQLGSATTWLIKPRKPINPIVTRKVHGIHNADVANQPSWADVETQVTTALAGRVLVAHNATVEHDVLRAHLPGWAPTLVLDTLRLARHVWPRLGSYGLDHLTQHLTQHLALTAEDIDGRRHRATYDAQLTWRLLNAALTTSGATWNTLVDVSVLPGVAAPGDGLW